MYIYSYFVCMNVYYTGIHTHIYIYIHIYIHLDIHIQIIHNILTKKATIPDATKLSFPFPETCRTFTVRWCMTCYIQVYMSMCWRKVKTPQPLSCFLQQLLVFKFVCVYVHIYICIDRYGTYI